MLVMLASIAANYAFGLWIAGRDGPARDRPGREALPGAGGRRQPRLAGRLQVLELPAGQLRRALDRFRFRRAGVDGRRAAPDRHLVFHVPGALSTSSTSIAGMRAPSATPFDLCLYIALFPQLIAGPIVRYQQIESQLSNRSVDWERMALGVRRFVVGLGKKVLIATPLSAFVDQIYGLGADELSLTLAWLGARRVHSRAVLRLLRLLGHGDRPLGHMLGFRFPENFDYPYIARSVREMWRRWHMSLTTWFRDYLYVPLGGNRRGVMRTYFNLMTIFVLCGLWHGAQWTFVLFGVFFGRVLDLRAPARPGVPARPRRGPLQHVYAIAVWILGMVPFRATSVEQTTLFWRAMGGWNQPAELRRATEFLTLEAPAHARPGRPVRTAGLARPAALGAAAQPRALGPRRARSRSRECFSLSVIYLAASTHNPVHLLPLLSAASTSSGAERIAQRTQVALFALVIAVPFLAWATGIGPQSARDGEARVGASSGAPARAGWRLARGLGALSRRFPSLLRRSLRTAPAADSGPQRLQGALPPRLSDDRGRDREGRLALLRRPGQPRFLSCDDAALVREARGLALALRAHSRLAGGSRGLPTCSSSRLPSRASIRSSCRTRWSRSERKRAWTRSRAPWARPT